MTVVMHVTYVHVCNRSTRNFYIPGMNMMMMMMKLVVAALSVSPMQYFDKPEICFVFNSLICFSASDLK